MYSEKYRKTYSKHREVENMLINQEFINQLTPVEVSFIRIIKFFTYVITKDRISVLEDRICKGISEKRLRTVTNKIEALLNQKIPDDHDRSVLIKLLFLTVIDKTSVPESVVYPDAVKTVAERYGLKL